MGGAPSGKNKANVEVPKNLQSFVWPAGSAEISLKKTENDWLAMATRCTHTPITAHLSVPPTHLEMKFRTGSRKPMGDVAMTPPTLTYSQWWVGGDELILIFSEAVPLELLSTYYLIVEEKL